MIIQEHTGMVEISELRGGSGMVDEWVLIIVEVVGEWLIKKLDKVHKWNAVAKNF